MSAPNQQELLSDSTQASISWRVRSGFYASDKIVESLVDVVSHEQSISNNEAKRRIRAVLAAEWSAHLQRQQSWPPGPTISDRLAKAFEVLERRHGIIAKMNFTCCQGCGISEIGQDVDDDDTYGYVFFHEQDTEAAVDGMGLSLAFGSFTKSKRKSELVADKIIKSLRRAGVKANWEGDVGKRITVECDEWRRRFGEDEDMDDIADDDFDTECVSDDNESSPEPDTQSDLTLDGKG